nr:bacterial Ig-like domain-containing protein [Enterococcus faecalis]
MKWFGGIINKMNQRTIYYGSIGTALFLSSGMLIASVNSYANEATTPGKYTVTYEVDGKIETATITVKENQTELKLKDTLLEVNQEWSPLDNVVFLKDKEGRPLNLENVIIENNVNTQKIGLYFVTFRYGSYLSIAKVYVTPANFNVEGTTLAERPYSQAMIGPERPIIASRQDKEQHTKQEKKKNKIEQERANKKVLLNDELLKKIDTIAPVEVTGGAASGPSQFGTTLSFLSGSLLYGTRRV